MSNWTKYRNKTYTHQEARKMDYELDILHGLISDLYDVEECTDRIRETLDKVNRVVRTKPDLTNR